MHHDSLDLADEIGAGNADAPVQVEGVADVRAVPVAAGRDQDVVVQDLDVRAGRTEVPRDRALKNGKGGGDESGGEGELHCWS